MSLSNKHTNRIKGFFVNNALVFAAFFLPVLIMILAFAVQGIYPFGENQIAIIDMYHQYVPFLGELQDKLKEGGSLFYTWNGAGGSNFWCLLSYYGASPLNLLLILFPEKLIMEAVTVILLIKIGLAGSFMYINLRDQKKSDITSSFGVDKKGWLAVAFACCYALCSYVMGYFWCIMWMDAVMLLPLCIMGLRKIIQGKGIALYSITLGLIVFCNYYISIMVCIFILLYFPVLYFTRSSFGVVSFGAAKVGKKQSAIICAKTTVKAVVASFLGIGLAALMLLPTYLSMQSTYYISSEMPEDTVLYNSPLDILNQMLPNAHLTYRDGLPNLYCGMVVVIMLVVYILLKNIPARDKIINGAFLVVMFFSLNINKLDFMWHGFHFPNELPFRYSFVICFVLVGMGYRAMQHIGHISANQMYGILAAGVAYYLIADKILADKLDNADVFFYTGVALLVMYIVVLATYVKGVAGRKEMTALLVAVVVAELCCGTCSSMEKAGNSTRSAYQDNFDSVSEIVEYIDAQPFARAETDSQTTINEPARLHIKGLSQFSSALNANTTGLMEEIGLEGEPGKNRFNYNLTNPVTNAMLNVKYLVSPNGEIEDDNFDYVMEVDQSKLYENKYPLSIGYVVPESIRSWSYDDENPFYNLDDYVRAVTNGMYEGVFESVSSPEISAQYAYAELVGDDYIEVTTENSSQQNVVVLSYVAEKTDNHYVFVETSNAESIYVERDNEAYNVEIENDCGSIVNIGKVQEGEQFDIRITYNIGVAGSITSHVCTMNNEAWQDVYDQLSSTMMTVTDYGDTYLKGIVDLDEYGVLVTSVPYDEGWTLKIDGKKKEINDLTGDVWISSALDEGKHKIELNFRPPGFIKGLLISILSALIILLYSISERLRPLIDRLRSRLKSSDDDDELEDEFESYKHHESDKALTTEDISSKGI